MRSGLLLKVSPVGLLAASICLTLPAAGLAQERWAAAETEARALLPAPRGETSVLSASMMCAASLWSFELDLEPEARAGDGAARMIVDSTEFETESSFSPSRIEIPVPAEALEPLKRGLRLSFTFEQDDDMLGQPQFSLIGSRVAITAMEELCSRPDMSAYRAVTFTPFSSYMALARELRETDIEQFRLATMSEPELTVAMAEFGDGRRVLFTRLCGSSWYFGRSGCNVTGFGPQRGEMPWRIVYDSEGVDLHIDDDNDQYGWPDLVTLPLRGQGLASTWRWQGSSYGLVVD